MNERTPSGAPDETTALQTIYAALSNAVTIEQVTQVLVIDCAEALGAATGGLWVVSEDLRALELVRRNNLSAAADTVARLPLDGTVPAPAVDAVRTGEPVFLSGRRELAGRYPEIDRIAAQRPEMALVALPLRVEGQSSGVVAFTFDRVRPFPPAERDFFRLLASTFGQTLARARLYESERAARERLEILASASATLSSSLDYETTLQTVVALAMPRVADFGFFDVVEGERDDQVRRIARAYQDPDVEALLAATRWQRSTRLDKNLCALSSGQSGYHPDIDDAWMQDIAASPEHLAVLRRLAFCSMITVPLDYQGRLLGALTLFYAGSGRRHTRADLELAEELARRAAAAVENARLYRELEAAYELARVADRRKDEFLAVLGHELRNPLAPIQTALEIMRLRGDGGEREREVIARQVRHLVRLVDDLLDISRVTRGAVELKREAVDVGEVLARAVEMSSPLLERRQHRFTLEPPPAGTTVIGDRVRLAQVVSNLLTNAARYTDPGGEIAVTARRDDAEVVLAVRDNGIGITPELLPALFEPFVQGARRPDRAEGGLGIGLTLVRSLAELHGGSVRAHSDGAGRGATFEVRLPLAPDGVRELTPPAVPVAVAATAGRRVLVVDDNRDAAETLADGLRALGHEVITAHDGPSALDAARGFAPNVALLDIGLPVMDGYELARQLRELAGPAVRLVAVTGYGQENDRTRSAAAGFDAHLVKPVELDAVARELVAADPA